MLFEEKTMTLKNGLTAVFKSPELSDAEGMLEYIKTACDETEFLLRDGEEWENTTVEQEAAWIQGLRTSPDTLAIACYVEGRIAGNCEISFQSGRKIAHRATVALALRKAYWNLGIGSIMLAEMLHAAGSRGVEIVELEFIEGNQRAQRLYEKNGFQIVCEKPRAFKMKDGTYRSEFHMQKYLP